MTLITILEDNSVATTTPVKQINITPPTTNVDGSPIASDEIGGYTLGVRDTGAAGSVAGTYPYSVTVPAGTTVELLSLLSPALPAGKQLVAAAKTLGVAGVSQDSAWGAETAPFSLPETLSPPVISVA